MGNQPRLLPPEQLPLGLAEGQQDEQRQNGHHRYRGDSRVASKVARKVHQGAGHGDGEEYERYVQVAVPLAVHQDEGGRGQTKAHDAKPSEPSTSHPEQRNHHDDETAGQQYPESIVHAHQTGEGVIVKWSREQITDEAVGRPLQGRYHGRERVKEEVQDDPGSYLVLIALRPSKAERLKLQREHGQEEDAQRHQSPAETSSNGRGPVAAAVDVQADQD